MTDLVIIIGLTLAACVVVGLLGVVAMHRLRGRSLRYQLIIATLLPEGPQFYPDDIITEESDESRMAELIREAALEGVRDELPHSIAVSIEEILPHEGRDDMVDVHATVYVERQSQKSIVLGKGGSRMREVGTTARAGIEKLLGTKVYLDLHVKVLKEWQRDPKMLGRLGF